MKTLLKLSSQKYSDKLYTANVARIFESKFCFDSFQLTAKLLLLIFMNVLIFKTKFLTSHKSSIDL